MNIHRKFELMIAIVVLSVVAPAQGAPPPPGGQIGPKPLPVLCFGMRATNNPTAGDDVIMGSAGDDVFVGGAGNDVILGYGGNDRLCGGDGNDRIRGHSGKDEIDGGPGDDDLGGGEWTAGSATGVSCGLADGDTGDFLVTADPGTNEIYGGTGDDTITGGGAADSLYGGDGRDCLMSLAGDDHLAGGSGADFISAGSGHDTALGEDDYDELFGQNGNDVLYAASANVQVPEFPASCWQSGELPGVYGPVESGGSSRSLLKENFLVGGDGYDRLIGSNRGDSMQGDERGDDLYGLGGNDDLRGGPASDCLSGGPDQDNLNDTYPDCPVFEIETLFDPQYQFCRKHADSDTLWGGDGVDELNARDGDSLDVLNGGYDGGYFSLNSCGYEPANARDRGDANEFCGLLLP